MGRIKQAVSQIWPMGHSLLIPKLAMCFPKCVLYHAHRCFMGKGFHGEKGMGNAGQKKTRH